MFRLLLEHGTTQPGKPQPYRLSWTLRGATHKKLQEEDIETVGGEWSRACFSPGCETRPVHKKQERKNRGKMGQKQINRGRTCMKMQLLSPGQNGEPTTKALKDDRRGSFIICVTWPMPQLRHIFLTHSRSMSWGKRRMIFLSCRQIGKGYIAQERQTLYKKILEFFKLIEILDMIKLVLVLSGAIQFRLPPAGPGWLE